MQLYFPAFCAIMFRRINTKLPNDPEYPHDLEKLGYVCACIFLSTFDTLSIQY